MWRPDALGAYKIAVGGAAGARGRVLLRLVRVALSRRQVSTALRTLSSDAGLLDY